jgi:prevent-host-death family protein
MRWQTNQARQRFSEVLRTAATEGPQIVTRRGEEIAVVLSIEEYRRLKSATADFKTVLFSGSSLEDLELVRPTA